MKTLYADIIIDISASRLDRSFQYRVPAELEDAVREGVKVRVPFGKGSRLTDGYVVGLSYEPKCDESIIKDIESCPDNYITAEEKLMRLAAWMRDAYGSTFAAALKTVLPIKEKKKRKSSSDTVKYPDVAPKPLEKLNKEQQKAYDGIKNELSSKRKRPCLISGVTGSGKTHIYMHLISDAFKAGKQAILLVPEISLTWQTISRFYACFRKKAAALHSRMSKGEKSVLLDRVKSGEVRLVIGPRSALFVPFENLGLIIIDEEHDSSYQSDMSPRYSARETAKMRADMENVGLVLGSATPSLEARYRCDTGEYALFELKNRYAAAALPQMQIVDMRGEFKAGNKSVISRALQIEIEQRLDRKEQVMLFLNKRGHTGFYTCRACGNVVKCPHCDIALTYHNNGLLMCHYCGYKSPMIKQCPSCGSPYIGGFRAGTQKVEAEVKKLFPGAKILRMDRDTTTKKDSHEKLLKSFAAGMADILIGTQMIVKGHDFKNLSLVGILAADASLYSSDFRAAERTYQLIVQAAGRSGRGECAGLGMIQTYTPDNYAIKAAAVEDYEAFYQEEIRNRKIMNYPPAGQLVSIHAACPDERRLSNAMAHIRKYIEERAANLTLLGPAPESVAKLKDSYRKVMYIKAQRAEDITKIRRMTRRYIDVNSGFDGITIQFALNA